MHLDFYATLLILGPLIGALVVGLTSSIISDRLAQLITCAGACISALSAFIIFNFVVFDGKVVNLTLFHWIWVEHMHASFGVHIDVLTSIMLALVTGVSTLVHIYSIGYMGHDEHKPRFMAYLSLFTFCMIMLVSASNLIQLFFGWEGVGLSSYLLIGFWFKRDSARAAAIKAFLVNRVGDIFLALGIMMVFINFGTVEYDIIFRKMPEVIGRVVNFAGHEVSVITVICLLMFGGCMGKSAQIGLHTWLPDAMEGPTPVSALIHAATMVTAGVFLLARLSPLFEYSDVARDVVTFVGAITCLFAAAIALVQTDIKKIIAYSTCSQLGYMFFAAGVSAYAAAIFHLLLHGFFKALLFLGAGSVIHAMSGEQNIFKMGGTWRLIPFTYVMMWIGSLALGGIYPFDGFYSKDIILEAAYGSGSKYGKVAYYMGTLAAMFTAFYSWRLLLITFHGKTRASSEVLKHVHESPLSMTFPLFILAIGSIFGGYIGSHFSGIVAPSGDFWRGAIIWLPSHNSLEAAEHVTVWVKYMPLCAGLSGILMAYILYVFSPLLPHKLYSAMRSLHSLLMNKFYFDELYELLFVRTSKAIGTILWRSGDVKIVDNMPNGASLISARFAALVGAIQSGYIYHYALMMFFGIVILVSWSLIRFYGL